MNNTRLFGIGLLMAGWWLTPAGAQVPTPLYMQGQFLDAGAHPSPGAHAITATVFSNGMAAIAKSMTVTADASGLANFTIDDPSLAKLFQTCTNAAFQLTGGPVQQLVTAPYAFQAGNLPMSSGNFDVHKDLVVKGESTLKALTVVRDARLSGPMRVGGRAHFTNVQEVVFNGNLLTSGGLMVGGNAVFNYDASLNNASVTSLVYGATNQVVLSNTLIRGTFTLATNDMTATGASSATAPEDGLLLVYTETTKHTGSGVSVTIGGTSFILRYYLEEHLNKKDLRMRACDTFPVQKGVQWSVSLVDSGDGSGDDNIKFTCYWVSFGGDG